VRRSPWQQSMTHYCPGPPASWTQSSSTRADDTKQRCLGGFPSVRDALRRGLPVFTIPGVYLTLPSAKGDVRFTPLFLSRRQLDDTVCAAQDLAIRAVSDAGES